MNMTNDLTPYALSAYETRMKTGFTANPHIWSSPAFYAHEIGIYLAMKGMASPKDVRMSRGYSIRANGMIFKINDQDNNYFRFERIK
jgi:hypothetical protein